MRRDDKALLRILLLLSAIRVNRGLLCLGDNVERGIDAPHLPDDLGCGGADLSVITGPPFFPEETSRVVVGMSNGPTYILAAATSKAPREI